MKRIEEPIHLFLIAAEEDAQLQQQLQKHLVSLQPPGRLPIWQPLLGGESIEQAFEKAMLIVLLVSADFQASSTCQRWMQRALERCQRESVQMIPILVRPVEWEGAAFSHLQILPTNRKPVTLWSNQDAAWAHIIACIRCLLEDTPLPSIGESRSASHPHNDFATHQDKLFATIDTDEIIGLFHQFLNVSSKSLSENQNGRMKKNQRRLATHARSASLRGDHLCAAYRYPMERTSPRVGSQFDCPRSFPGVGEARGVSGPLASRISRVR